MVPLRILHTADIHLGAKFLGLGRKGAEQRGMLLEAFDAIARLAVEEKVGLLLVAGDLFDSNRVSRELLARVASRFEELAGEGVTVCLSPGTHDPYGPASPYAAPPLSELSGLTVFSSEEMTPAGFPELDCTVYGNANMKPFENKYPLAGLEVRDEGRWRIGMLHASFEIPDVVEDTYVVTASQVASSRLDYLALGHQHSLSDRSGGGVKAFYPGSPEMVRMQKGDFGNVLLVELGDETTVTPVRVGRRSFEELTVKAEEIEPVSRLVTVLDAHADPDKVLKLSIEGIRRVSCPDTEALVEGFRDRFFHLLLSDRSWPAAAAVDPECYPEGSPSRVYLEILKAELDDAAPSEKEEVLEAMQVGLSLLGEGGG